MSVAKFLIIGLVGFMVVALFFPPFRQVLTRLFTPSETVVVGVEAPGGAEEAKELEIVTLLGFDAIPAILNPDFVSAAEAEAWMEPDEQVLGLSINGDNRAYSIRMLSRHEIVNDEVGGVPVAVTW